MSVLSLAQLEALASSVGFPNPALAAAVAMAESGGNPNALGDPQYGGSYGLWQINLPSHPQYANDPSVLYDPTTNAQAALAISSGGTNWQPWTTYRTGAYKRYYRPTGGGLIAPVAILVIAVGLFGSTVGWWHLPGTGALERYARRAWNA